MQDPTDDGDASTSEGVFVFTRSAPAADLTRGTAAAVSGTVSEFRPGGDGTANLSITQIGASSVEAGANVGVPAASVLGPDGRTPPSRIIEDDSCGDVEQDNTFDPAEDGIDFWESMEGMRVRVQAPEVVGPTSRFDELPVVTDGATVRTVRDGIVLRGDEDPSAQATDEPTDGNPERIILDALSGTSMPAADVGDTLADDAVGVLDYSFGNYKLYVDESPRIFSGSLSPETTSLDGNGGTSLTVGTYNVENLDASDPASKFTALAEGIVDNLAAPDVLTLEEVQDNTGSTDDGTVAANQTLDQLVAAIEAAGGPHYGWRQISPQDKSDGGEPGGNIRVAFLFRTDRGLRFVDRGDGDATAGTDVVGNGSTTRLSLSPGRVAPTSSAWTRSRKPLAGEFSWQGRSVFVVANHFASKSGDDPLFGRFQPPRRSSEEQRHQQARVLRGFVDGLLRADPQARIVVAGDINDFEFSETADLLVDSGATALTDLPRTLPQPERYTYEFDGNSQVLDHILVSPALDPEVSGYDIVHTNAEFAVQVSDHDPQVAQLSIDGPEDTTLTLAAEPRNVTFRDEVRLSGELSDGTEEGTEGREIAIEATTADGSEVVARATTRIDGTYSAQVMPQQNSIYRARYAGGDDNASRSENVSVAVAPVVKAFPSDDDIKRKDTLQVAGVVAPPDAVETARLEAKTTAGWRVLASGSVGTDGEYALRWSPSNADKGRYVMRVATTANDRFTAGSSPTFRVRVR